jgi:hypothetical protein
VPPCRTHAEARNIEPVRTHAPLVLDGEQFDALTRETALEINIDFVKGGDAKTIRLISDIHDNATTGGTIWRRDIEANESMVTRVEDPAAAKFEANGARSVQIRQPTKHSRAIEKRMTSGDQE